jgi:hypothetical protein
MKKERERKRKRERETRWNLVHRTRAFNLNLEVNNITSTPFYSEESSH